MPGAGPAGHRIRRFLFIPQNRSFFEKIFFDINIEKSQKAPPITQSTIYIAPETAENGWVTVAGTATELL